MFAVTAVAAAIAAAPFVGRRRSSSPWSLFFGGMRGVLVGLRRRRQRSRDARPSAWAAVFFLAGSAPGRCEAHLFGSLGVEVVVALVTAGVQPVHPAGLRRPRLVCRASACAGLWGGPARHLPPPPSRRRDRTGPLSMVRPASSAGVRVGAMAEQATRDDTIDAPPQSASRRWSTSSAIPSGPATSSRPTVVETRRRRPGRRRRVPGRRHGSEHHLPAQYDYSGAPNRLAWELLSGDLKQARRCLPVEPSAEARERTDSSTSFEVDLIVPIPGFVKRRAEARIIKRALSELKTPGRGDVRPVGAPA